MLRAITTAVITKTSFLFFNTRCVQDSAHGCLVPFATLLLPENLGFPKVMMPAGMKINESTIADITPKAVKSPKYLIGYTSEVSREINPTEVVTEVMTTGFHMFLTMSMILS